MKSLPLILFMVSSPFVTVNAQQTQSSFNEIKQILLEENVPQMNSPEIASELKIYQKNKLPHYEVSAKNFFERVGNHVENLIFNAADRTLSEHADYYPRLKKLLHPNGVCFSGQWLISEDLGYSGLFKKGSKALVIARASVGFSDTTEGTKRAFGLAAKLFPTVDKDEKVMTANFFSMNNLAGDKSKSFFSKALTNNPVLGVPALNQLQVAFHVATAFKKADGDPSFRPLTPLSHAGESSRASIRTPKWMKVEATDTTKALAPTNDGLDFRLELNSKNYPQGIVFNIYVSDETNRPKETDKWNKIGMLRLTDSVVSYGCDRRLHFPHPRLEE